MPLLRRLIHWRATNTLCEEAVRLHRIIDAYNQKAAEPGSPDSINDTFVVTLNGRLIGIRTAICVLQGWNPRDDADKEGPADERVLAYWERKYPADWQAQR
jgi:hypothetical protein